MTQNKGATNHLAATSARVNTSPTYALPCAPQTQISASNYSQQSRYASNVLEGVIKGNAKLTLKTLELTKNSQQYAPPLVIRGLTGQFVAKDPQ